MRRARTVVVALLLAACGRAADGKAAYEAGRFDEALRHFSEAERAAPSPELAFDVALAALRGGDLDTAESAAARAFETSAHESDVRADARFVLGAAAYERCLREMKQAARPESEPFAYDGAERLARRAAAEWAASCVLRGDWPEAARNVERALARAAECRTAKSEAEAAKKRKQKAPPERKPAAGDTAAKGEEDDSGADGSADDGTGGREPSRGAPLPDLAPAELETVYERLTLRERTKIEDRRARQRRGRSAEERDW